MAFLTQIVYIEQCWFFIKSKQDVLYKNLNFAMYLATACLTAVSSPLHCNEGKKKGIKGCQIAAYLCRNYVP